LVNIPAFNGLTFWSGLPVALLMGVAAGVLLGVPVLRMRGDYLAIVTLGFGEIIRLLLLNLRDYTGGPGGVLNIPSPIIFGVDLGNPKGILYLAMILSAMVTFLTVRLRDSRLGRAWVALREDEDVAQAMGINLVAIKLLAFASGAGFAAIAGALYAARQVNIFPDNFTLLVSIDVLSLIIIGGMGSIEGVVLGSIALIGLPEILRSVNEYRIVAYGALLVVMMILRPEGLLPSARRQRELRTEIESPEFPSATD
jgi:branched-chain amino acid transport system permease protein